MTNPRVRKIADRIHVIVAEMLERRIKDPRLGFVTVTDVRVTGDTQQATIYYTVLGETDASTGDHASPAAALESAKGVLRSEVGKQLGMRHVPTLTFIRLPEISAFSLPLICRSSLRVTTSSHTKNNLRDTHSLYCVSICALPITPP